MKMKKTLKALRVANELSEENVALELKVPVDLVLAVEAGTKELSLNELKKVSDFFNVPCAKIISFIELEEDEASFKEIVLAYLKYELEGSDLTCVRFNEKELDTYLEEFEIEKHKTMTRYLIKYANIKSEPYVFGDDPIKILKRLTMKQLLEIRNIGVKNAKQIYDLLH